MRTLALAIPVLVIVSGCSDGRVSEMPEGAPYGTSCTADADCESALCVTAAEQFCSQECGGDCSCPAGASCYRVSDTLSVCAPGANTCDRPTEDAAVSDAAVADATPSPDTGTTVRGGGAADPCTATSECDSVLSGGGTGPDPEYSRVDQHCLTEAATGIPGGICTMSDCELNFARDPCPGDTECLQLRTTSLCVDVCDRGADCRDGWTCRDDLNRWDSVCWLSCARTGCAEGLECQASGSCGEPVVVPVDYDVTERSLSLGPPLTSVSGMTAGTNLTFRLPFAINFFGVRHAEGIQAVANWQGLFSFGRTAIMSYVPGDHTRYETAAPLIVALHYANTSSRDVSIVYRASGAPPSRVLEVEWETANLSGTGGARFRVRFDEGSDAFVIHYGPITDDAFAESWTQLAMGSATSFEDHIVSRGTPRPGAAANSEFTYTPR